jgi:hypothetical protein
MPHVIHVSAQASIASIQVALAGTRARDIGLAFPLGRPCVAGTDAGMYGLRAHCLALQKNVVILGGDEHLRAVAVASGFPAATSLAEWEAALPRIAAAPPFWNADALWNTPPFSLVPLESERDAAGDPFDPFDEIPPSFVLELMARGGEYGAPDADDEHPLGGKPESPPENELLDAHEQYEEHITRAIRHTGGLSLSRPTHPPIAPFPAISPISPEEVDGGDSRSV